MSAAEVFTAVEAGSERRALAECKPGVDNLLVSIASTATGVESQKRSVISPASGSPRRPAHGSVL
jgi:hypothetical protein